MERQLGIERALMVDTMDQSQTLMAQMQARGRAEPVAVLRIAIPVLMSLVVIRVGVKVLQECISRAGSIEGGLKLYVGAGNMEDDGGYSAKVLAEHHRLQLVASGRAVPLMNPQAIPVRAPVVEPQAPENVASLFNS